MLLPSTCKYTISYQLKHVISITMVLVLQIIRGQETKHCLTNQGCAKCHNKTAKETAKYYLPKRNNSMKFRDSIAIISYY